MADPRSGIDFEGLDANYVTLLIDNVSIVYDATKVGGSSAVGFAVSMATDKTAALAADGQAIVGKLMLVEPDGKANVQHEGFMSLAAGSAQTVTAGSSVVGALGPSSAKGYIRNALAADALNSRGTVIDASTQTAIYVDF